MNATVTTDQKNLSSSLSQEVEKLTVSAQEALSQLQNNQVEDGRFTGWYNFPKRKGFALADEISSYVDSIDFAYDLVVVIGIGGSYLGTKAVVEATKHTYQGIVPGTKPLVVYLGHHLSEAEMIETLDLIGTRSPVVDVISKSGTTTEPSIAFRLVKQSLEARYGKKEANKRIIATTDPENGALLKLAKKVGYQTFAVPTDIGGRYSVLSAVGLVPLALAGVNIRQLLEGADSIFTELETEALAKPCLDYASFRVAAYQSGKKIEVLAYANPKLMYFVEWWKQLFGESEGKGGIGLFPTGLGSTTDLHSLGQFLQEGDRCMIETFLSFDEQPYSVGGIDKVLRVPATEDEDGLGYLESKRVEVVNQAAVEATQIAHSDGGVPNVSLTFPVLDERGIGQMFAFFETACAVSCLLMKVNPFDQPGVEAYKKNLFAIMGRPGYEDLQKELMNR